MRRMQQRSLAPLRQDAAACSSSRPLRPLTQTRAGGGFGTKQQPRSKPSKGDSTRTTSTQLQPPPAERQPAGGDGGGARCVASPQ